MAGYNGLALKNKVRVVEFASGKQNLLRNTGKSTNGRNEYCTAYP
jgi:hypothetical protein